MEDGAADPLSGFTYTITQASRSALSPHPLPAVCSRELLHGALRKDESVEAAGTPSSESQPVPAGAADSLAPRSAGDAPAAHAACGAVPASPGSVL